MFLNSCDYLENKAYDLDPSTRRRLLLKLKYMEPDERKAVIESMRLVGIKIAYNWVGHRGEYFFPSFEDALREEEWEFHCFDF